MAKEDKKQEETSNRVENVLSITDKIGRAFSQIEKTNPSIGFGITFNGDKSFSIAVSFYENYLNYTDRKMKALAEASGTVDFLIKKVKELYKKDNGETLTVKELGENSDVTMISGNGRFKLAFKKAYLAE